MSAGSGLAALTRSVEPCVSLSDDGQAFTTSLDVAAVFGKRHDHVLRDIAALMADLPPDRLPNFGETVIERENPSGGAPIPSPAFNLTRDGFTLLAMGFTGKEALAFKLAYMDAFNTMEAQLHRLYMVPLADDREDFGRASPRLWPILSKQSHALLVQLRAEPDPLARRNLFWMLYRVNVALGIPVPSAQALDVQLPALPGGPRT